MKPKKKPTAKRKKPLPSIPMVEQVISRIYRRQIQFEKELVKQLCLMRLSFESLQSGQKMLSERLASLYEFIEKSHDEMHATINGSDIPEIPDEL